MSVARKANEISRLWALIGMVVAVAVGTVATIGWLTIAIDKSVKVHNGAASSHQHYADKFVTRRELAGTIKAQVQEATQPTSKRLSSIERQQRTQWRVIRVVLTGDRAAARRVLRENTRED